MCSMQSFPINDWQEHQAKLRPVYLQHTSTSIPVCAPGVFMCTMEARSNTIPQPNLPYHIQIHCIQGLAHVSTYTTLLYIHACRTFIKLTLTHTWCAYLWLQTQWFPWWTLSDTLKKWAAHARYDSVACIVYPCIHTDHVDSWWWKILFQITVHVNVHCMLYKLFIHPKCTWCLLKGLRAELSPFTVHSHTCWWTYTNIGKLDG